MPTLSEKKLQQQIATFKRENIELRTELEKAQKLAYVGSIATTVAHEFCQPTHAIRTMTGAALDDIKDNIFEINEINPLLERVYHQTTRLNQLIQNFRQFARSDKNHQEVINLNQLLEKTIANDFEERFKNAQIQLIKQFALQELIVETNPFQLQAVLSILLNNAKDALKNQNNATVWVTTFQTQQEIGFKVEDNGTGLSPKYRSHLFEPFVTTKTTEHGTGLGLHLASKIIQDLKGQLSYQDRTEGGANFIITLPAYKK